MNLIIFVDKDEKLDNCFVCARCRKNAKNIMFALYEKKLIVTILLCDECALSSDYDIYNRVSTRFFKKYVKKCNLIITNNLYVHDENAPDFNNRLINYDITKLLS
mgnify:CR=1 FL=1